MSEIWKTEEGKKQLEKVLELLKSSKSRVEFKRRFLELENKPPFKGVKWVAMNARIRIEAKNKKSEMGKLWKQLPKGCKGKLGLNWTEEMKESFRQDWASDMPIEEIWQKYKNPSTGKTYKNYEYSKLGTWLGVSRKQESVKGGGMEDLTKEIKANSEEELIELREKNTISVEKFLEGLKEVKSELVSYWEVIAELLQKKRTLRNTDLLPFAGKLNITGKEKVHKLNAIRGILTKFAEWDALVVFKIDNHYTYFSNLDGFYTPEELFNLIPQKQLKLVNDSLTSEPQQIHVLADKLDKVISRNLLVSLLEHYVNYGLVKFVKTKAGYCLTERGVELGVDAQSFKTLQATALENALFIQQEETGTLPKSLQEVGEALERDVAKKTVPVTDLSKTLVGKDIKILFLGEIMYGSQYTDQKLLDWILGNVQEPSLVMTSGLVQGRFEVRNKAKSKMLAEEGGLHKIENQFHSAGLLLEWLERITTSHVCVVQSDDDWRLAEDYGTLMHLGEGKNPWKFGVSWESFSAEMKRRLENKELRRKIKIQWEIIQTYMYRIGRSLLNKKEVYAKIGVNKNEYRLIIEIMVAKRNGFDYPKEYEEVVNVDALYQNIGKRIVTADPLRIKLGEGKEIRLVHNAGFSDITQYQKTIQHLDAIARHVGLSREELPYVLADFHQESFFTEYLMGTWIMNLPGLQNTSKAAAYTQTEWSTKILEAKERRQSRVRKEPASSSAPEITFCEDGRVRFRLLNNSIRKIIEDQKNDKEREEVAVIGTDWQFGSITEWPELVVKFLDYGLYKRRATRLYMNGDFIHGSIYPQHNAENRDTRLTTLHAQQKFGFELITPIVLDAPALIDFAAWLGNHEWNNMSAKYQGDSPLTFIETALQGVLMERRRAGTATPLERAMTVSRVRWRDTHNPQGDIVNWPFFADTICGFKVAIQHMWHPFGGEDTATDAKNWLKRMAKAARNIDVVIGGHKHSVYMTQIADKWAISAGAAASQSGYELARGMMSTVMFTLVEFSNRRGITVEFVPWEFLMKYKLQCPFYKGKDELFVRPAEGTDAYKRGKMAPYIETLIDSLTQYLEI